MPSRTLIGLGVALFVSGVQGAAAACVENGVDQRLFFTVEARDDGLRETGWLDQGERLCLEGARGANILTAFETDTSVEGCPRIAEPAESDTLLDFVPVDSCRWASHGQ